MDIDACTVHHQASWSNLRILTLNGSGTDVSPLLYITGGRLSPSSGSKRNRCRRRARKRNISALYWFFVLGQFLKLIKFDETPAKI